MKRHNFASLFLAALPLLASCDDGRIYPETVAAQEGKVVKLEGVLEGMDSWSGSYHLAIAGFSDGNGEYADISKIITATDVQDGRASIVLSGIKEDIVEVRLCVLDRLRRHIVTFESVDVTAASDTVRMNVGTLNVGMFGAIQQSVLNTTCANCHGASNEAAAGLYLTEGRSYAAMVGQPSSKVEGRHIVEPAAADKSVLYQALAGDISAAWRYNHQSEVTSTDMLLLISNWINNGAKE